jgi:carbonic anhydrase
MDRLIKGYRRFKESYWIGRAEEFAEAGRTAQRPIALVVACVDSRVDPQLIFSADIGQILVVRNVANLVPPYAPDGDNHGTSAALEFAVRVLDIPNIVVMGHSSCGGVQALLNGAGATATDFIDNWMKTAAAARERALTQAGGDRGAAQPACEREVVKLSLRNLMTFPWIAGRVDQDRLRLHALLFDIEHGELLRLDDQGNFTAV